MYEDKPHIAEEEGMVQKVKDDEYVQVQLFIDEL